MTNTTSPNRKRRMSRELQQSAVDRPSAVANAPIEDLAAPSVEKRPRKAGIVLDLLQRQGGATLDELVEATDWLPHTTRAALTGLKKKGHTIERTKVDGISRYAVTSTAA